MVTLDHKAHDTAAETAHAIEQYHGRLHRCLTRASQCQ
jgi:hypothetical protein